jgi:hypothetical protein
MAAMRYVLFILVYLCFYTISKAQTTFEVCVDADKDGNCITKSKEFVVDAGAGGTIAFIVKNEVGLGTTTIKFKIYRVNNYGVERFDSEVDTKVQKADIWAVQDVTFYDPGTYKVKVYTLYDSFIANELITIIKKGT